MLTLKELDPSEIEMITTEIPQVECMCCFETASPTSRLLLPTTQKEWANAAFTCGWRAVETSDAIYSMVCPGCIGELEAIEQDNKKFETEQRREV